MLRGGSRLLALVILVGLAAVIGLTGGSARAQFKFKGNTATKEAPPAPKAAQLNHEAWKSVPMTPATPADIDKLVQKELAANQIKSAPLTTDEQFIRRVTIDVTGELPSAAAVTAFVADKDPQKRAKLIDKLLDSDKFARYVARYWRDVITSRVVDRRNIGASRAFEEWLFEELKANKSWGEIARAMLTADGDIRYDDPKKNGQAFFLLAQTGTDAANDRAAEASRVFLGIQIRCAQCHDHPFDQWKQVQFHELAGYFARTRDRQIREENKLVGVGLTALPRGEHEMPSTKDSKQTLLTNPRFLDGKTPAKNLSDKDRRAALADAMTDKDNYWFAGAYVNRLWGEAMGQAFYEPVDDIGPGKQVVFGEVLTRLAAHFRATNYDIKGMYRLVMNSQTYQRQFRLGDSMSDHNYFAAVYPTQLPADALWSALVGALGPFNQGPFGRPQPGAGGGFGARFGGFGLEGMFRQEFAFDPSVSAEEIEGTIPQALILMNNAQLNAKIKADRGNMLAKVLETFPRDEDAVEAVYLRTLARAPTASETAKCMKYIQKVGKRAEAFEDLLWSLINSTEFQTKR